MGTTGPQLRRSIVIHSPHSGRSAELSQALTDLQQARIEIVQEISIAELDNQPPQGANWQQQGIDIAIAAGGDGLVGGVINHVIESGMLLGILPLGTGNDIARSLRIPQDLHAAAQVIALGNLQMVDVGVAQPAEQAPHAASPTTDAPVLAHVSLQKRGFFAHALTIGLNVQFARIATNVATRQRFGRLTYPVATLEVLKSLQALEVKLHFEGLLLPNTGGILRRHFLPKPPPGSVLTDEATVVNFRALEVAVINAPIFGGQWNLAIPEASIADRLLDIVVIEDIDLGQLSRNLTRFFDLKEQISLPASNVQADYFMRYPGDLTDIPGIHHVQAKGVTIKTNADPMDATLDGEVRGQTPMNVHMANQRLRVLAPK